MAAAFESNCMREVSAAEESNSSARAVNGVAGVPVDSQVNITATACIQVTG